MTSSMRQALLALLLSIACSEPPPNDRQTGGESHFLRVCTGAADCGGLACICQRCTSPCDDVASCGEPASCTATSGPSAPAQCGDAPVERACLLECQVDADCGADHQCEAGLCAAGAPESLPTPDASALDSSLAASCVATGAPEAGWTSTAPIHLSCGCSDATPGCYGIYRARILSASGVSATLGISKLGELSGPSVTVPYEVLATASVPTCEGHPEAQVLHAGEWPAGQAELVIEDVPIWSDADAFGAWPRDAPRYVYVRTAGGDDPSTLRWWQHVPLVFYKRCEPCIAACEGRCGAIDGCECGGCGDDEWCLNGQCQPPEHTVSATCPEVANDAPWTCPGGDAEPICGLVSPSGEVQVRLVSGAVSVSDGWILRRFDPDAAADAQCTEGAAIASDALYAVHDGLMSPVLSPALAPGQRVGYCFTRPEGGSTAGLCSGRLVIERRMP